MHPSELFDALKKRNKVTSDSQLAKLIGLTPSRISQMRIRDQNLSPRQVASYIEKAAERGTAAAFVEPIRPIVEMYPIEHTSSRQDKNMELFPTGSTNPRNKAIRACLEKTIGVYLFFDSLGRAIYAGKTVKNLWFEMSGAFNRKRSNHQAFFIDHPSTGASFSPAWQSPRQPRKRIIRLYDTAMYFSAYEVSKPLIPNLEALLIRSFCNTLSNKKMEKFSRKKSGK